LDQIGLNCLRDNWHRIGRVFLYCRTIKRKYICCWPDINEGGHYQSLSGKNFTYIYSQTCIKISPLWQAKIGLLRQVTS